MPGPIQLRRTVRRYGRLAVLAVAALAVLAGGGAVRSVHAATTTHAATTAHARATTHAGATMDHAAGHDDGLALCVALGGCALAVAGTVAAVRRLAQRGLWALAQPTTSSTLVVVRPAPFLSRAGPPPALQVFRL